MALTLEDGTGVANADSFVSLAEVRAFASSRAKSVSATDATLEAQVRAAHDWLVSQEHKFQGYRTHDTQTLPFPRCGLALFGRSVDSQTIPQALKNAVCQLVVEIQTVDAQPTAEGRVVISETVGPLSTTYKDTGTPLALPLFPKVEGHLSPFYRSGGLLKVIRA